MPAVRHLLRVAAPLLMAAAPLAVPYGTVGAQKPAALRVGADNDAFNFWIPPWDRTDREYTSGVRGSLEYDGRIGWSRWPRFGRALTGDTSRSAVREKTTTHAFSLGQMIFTGNELTPNSLALYAPGYGPRAARPNAAWLYVEAAERDSTPHGLSEFSIGVGVVGPPALGQQMQHLFHSLGPEYQRPSDWSRQLPFEPGFVAKYTRTAPIASFDDGARWRGFVSATGGAAVGTILTAVSAGAEASTEVALGPLHSRNQMPRVAVSLGGKMNGVARDEFLDGTLFSSSDRVSKRAFVGDAHAAFTVRWRQLGVTYRANYMDRQYATQYKPAAWATIETEWRLNR